MEEEQCMEMYTAMGARKVEGIKEPTKRGKLLEEIRRDRLTRVIFPKEHFELFWIPDVFLLNAKDNYKQSFMLDSKFLQVDTQRKNDTKDGMFCQFRLMAR